MRIFLYVFESHKGCFGPVMTRERQLQISAFPSSFSFSADIPNARRQSISDRISRRRHSELAAEIIRLSAENRRREFAELLNEHKALVLEIESGEAGSEAGSPEEKCDEEENKENEQT